MFASEPVHAKTQCFRTVFLSALVKEYEWFDSSVKLLVRNWSSFPFSERNIVVIHGIYSSVAYGDIVVENRKCMISIKPTWPTTLFFKPDCIVPGILILSAYWWISASFAIYVHQLVNLRCMFTMLLFNPDCIVPGILILSVYWWISALIAI